VQHQTEDLQEKIAAFYGRLAADPHHRFRSWEHCYRFFRSRAPDALLADKNTAALQLGFYLASWGMYRGSSFLLQHGYTIHEPVVEVLAAPRFTELWDREVGSESSDSRLVPLILDAVGNVKEAYAPFGRATNTLATKVLLGTLGCLPACDRFFVDGFRISGRSYSSLNRRFVERIIQFCLEHGAELRSEQARIESSGGIYYPLMKLADMYFWQIGYEAEARRLGGDPPLVE
jgi:hypothetical protein